MSGGPGTGTRTRRDFPYETVRAMYADYIGGRIPLLTVARKRGMDRKTVARLFGKFGLALRSHGWITGKRRIAAGGGTK